MKNHYRQMVSILSLLILVLSIGCSSLADRGLLPEVASHIPPVVRLGTEMVLLDHPIARITILISKDEHIHLFTLDDKGQLSHLEVQNDRVISQMDFGSLYTDKTLTMDAVEQSNGQIRFLIGNRQYIFPGPGLSWNELKDNKCERFLPLGDKLFCAFVIPGEEVRAPKRTDVTFGFISIMPIIFWSNEQANKLVLAEETPQGWSIRAVVDPDTVLDANHDFATGIDDLGLLHLLYFTSRGGGFMIESFPELRYAQVNMTELVDQEQVSQEKSTAMPQLKTWQSISGKALNLFQAPFPPDGFLLGSIHATEAVNGTLRPLNFRFALNQKSGDFAGLLWGSMVVIDDTRKLVLQGPIG